jgi:hypothetical protein
VNEEISAMRAIARALENLPDDTARQRVLRWVLDHYAALSVKTDNAPDSSGSEG